jgi:hypothetical protein
VAGPLLPGGHVVQVQAVDAAGNVEPVPAVRAFTVTGSPTAPPAPAPAAPAPPALPPALPPAYVVGYDEYRTAPGYGSRSGRGPAATLVTRSATADSRGRVRLTLRCPAGRAACAGTLVLRGENLTSRTAFRVGAGRRATVLLRLGRAARRQIRRAGRLKLTAELPPSQRVTLTLRAPRR